MTYTMEIEGMHCGSCSKMIRMELEDRNFTQVQIDMMGKLARFVSPLDLKAAQTEIKALEAELGKYQFLNLQPAGDQ